MVAGATCLVFDEIQDCPRVRTSLKFFKTDGRFDVICTGSLLGVSGYKTQETDAGKPRTCWIEDAGIIRRCYNLEIPELPLDGNAIAEQFKVYMADTGLFVSMLEQGTTADILGGNPRQISRLQGHQTWRL